MCFPEYENCQLCPRRCGVNRARGQRGACGETAACRVSHLGPHRGEEPSFSGTNGSGTVFFSGCAAHCVFCQNAQISSGPAPLGRELTSAELLAAAQALLGQGVHNLNLVTPDHFWPHVRQLCRQLRQAGATQPFLANLSGYLTPALAAEMTELIELFLPDFKFADSALAARCLGDAAYPEWALASLRVLVAAKGFLTPFDPTGAATARRGVLVRHLVLPGQVGNSLRVLELLHREFGPDLPLSVMSQYRPMPACRGQGDLARGITAAEYDQVCDRVCELGFEQVYIQEWSEETAFLPDFAAPQPFAGNRVEAAEAPETVNPILLQAPRGEL